MLVSHNGVTSPEPITLSLKAGAAPGELQVHAKVANTMNGSVTNTDGTLKGMLMSTRMMGPPYFMGVERALSSGLAAGLKATRNEGTLTLSTDTDTLVYQPK